MAIVGGLDLHRKQITFDLVDTESGAWRRGRVAPANRESFREWLGDFAGEQVELAVEGCTGWRFVAEECAGAGVQVHLAEPADVAALKGRRRHAKTDRLDAAHLRELLVRGSLPECWIPPGHLLEIRARVRLYADLSEQQRSWQQRIRATLFHMGAPAQLDLADPQRLAGLGALTPATREATAVAAQMLEATRNQLDRVRAELVGFARRQPGCRALRAEPGIGPLLSVVILSELGDATRFPNSRAVVRHAGLDISVYASDTKRARGRLTRQGPPLLRWALYEAAVYAARAGSPDHAYYERVAQRIGKRRALLAVARRLLRRCYHRLRALGPAALAPVG
jgi:transposase